MTTISEVRTVTRGSWAAITALYRGSVVLAGRICRCIGRSIAWAWSQAGAVPAPEPAEDEPEKPPGKRSFGETAAIFGLGALLASGAISTIAALIADQLADIHVSDPVQGVITTAGGAGWAAAAWAVAPPPGPRKPRDKEAPPPSEEPVDPAAEPPTRDTVAALLRDLSGPTGGVHLKTLAGALPGGPWTTGQVRDLLTGMSIPVRAGVRMPGRSGLEGVHRDDVPPPPPPTPGGVVAAGQPGNNNTNNGVTVERREGMTIIKDPADHTRHHTV
ncbi:hypothetical protein [Streptomyces jumonjinensis]|uniref:Uncharacterized protein n=1 Tax=Streptomyces jumonjinensis TaxID=1945 RepID=A0A646KLG0_STRJU|nr:hypothetical protein [Streptomyces jumonjinensis]MQT03154.1 hypothetical protein [Streptomyces jumonjinensis]